MKVYVIAGANTFWVKLFRTQQKAESFQEAKKKGKSPADYGESICRDRLQGLIPKLVLPRSRQILEIELSARLVKAKRKK